MPDTTPEQGPAPAPAAPADRPRYDLVEAAWDEAHRLADEAFGPAAPAFFHDHGPELIAAVYGAPEGATEGDLLAVVREHIERAKAPKAPAKAGPKEVQSGDAQGT